MNKPKLFEKKYYNNRFYYTIKFNVMYKKSEAEWTWDSVNLPYGKFDYDTIVNAIVSYRYPADKMQAIINNYLLDKDDQKVIDEFNEMQEWRKYAKSHAKEILK